MKPEQKPLDRLAIARNLREMADLLSLTGEGAVRVRAYGRAAGILERLGRLVTSRPPIDCRVEEVLDALDSDAFARAVSPTGRT